MLSEEEEHIDTIRDASSGASWVPSSGAVEATLADEGSGYVYTLPDQLKLYFNASGELTSEEDRNGNVLTMAYDSKGQLESATDSAGRKITFTYNGEGQVESARDPMGHTIKYSYEGGNLASVTEPGETSPRWQFKYNNSHELTSETNGRGNATTTEYNALGQVVSQTDPMHRTRKWSYAATGGSGTETRSPNLTVPQPSSSSTKLASRRASRTRPARRSRQRRPMNTTAPMSWSRSLIRTNTRPNTATTRPVTARAKKNPDGEETKWEYNSTHDLIGITTPDGEKTTIERESRGNALSVSRPAPDSETQVTKYKYDSSRRCRKDDRSARS